MMKYKKIFLVLFIIVYIGIGFINNYKSSKKQQADKEDTVITTLENYFGKEGDFKVLETEMERGEMGQKYYIATVSTSYFDSTFTYYYNNNKNRMEFLDKLCRDKYGVEDGYLTSNNNPYFLAKKQETEDMMKKVKKNYNVTYTYILNDSNFENFGRLPSLEDINNKTEYFIYIDIFNPQNNYESILKDMKQILPFFKQKFKQKDLMTIRKVNYYENFDNYNKRPIIRDAEVYISGTSMVEIHIGDEYKTYIGNENFEFVEKEKSE